MNVSGIRPNAEIYSYNSIRLKELRNQQIAASKELQGARVADDFVTPSLENYDTPLKQNYSSYDYAQEYRVGETYELRGKDTDVAKLDVQRALSDMEKDRILQQYQYFVGDKGSNTKTQNPENVTYYSGENFIL